MLGAIAGDIIGSIYENFRTKRRNFRQFTPFSFFTDDTVLTVAVADAILHQKDYGDSIRKYAWRYPFAAMTRSSCCGCCHHLRKLLQQRYGYDLNRTVYDIRPHYRLNLTCQGSVLEAIIAFLDSNDFEDAIRNAVSLGGDADTQASIAGAIAEAFYGGVPDEILLQTWKRLNKNFQCVVRDFYAYFGMKIGSSTMQSASQKT